MKKLLLLSVLMLAGSIGLTAQARTSSIHIFPQFVEGKTGDGGFYVSYLVGYNVNPYAVDCTITPFGAVTRDIPTPIILRLKALSSGWISSPVGQSLVSGYVRLNCTGVIQAQLTYEYAYFDAPAASGLATVFSMNPVTGVSSIPMINPGSSFRYGIAIANDATHPIQVNLSLALDFGTEVRTTTKQVSIAANSQLVGFIDEWFTVPAGAVAGTIQAGVTSDPFYIAALVYQGAVFSTVVPF